MQEICKLIFRDIKQLKIKNEIENTKTDVKIDLFEEDSLINTLFEGVKKFVTLNISYLGIFFTEYSFMVKELQKDPE